MLKMTSDVLLMLIVNVRIERGTELSIVKYKGARILLLWKFSTTSDSKHFQEKMFLDQIKSWDYKIFVNTS